MTHEAGAYEKAAHHAHLTQGHSQQAAAPPEGCCLLCGRATGDRRVPWPDSILLSSPSR
jgi:hypothetical protein